MVENRSRRGWWVRMSSDSGWWATVVGEKEGDGLEKREYREGGKEEERSGREFTKLPLM